MSLGKNCWRSDNVESVVQFLGECIRLSQKQVLQVLINILALGVLKHFLGSVDSYELFETSLMKFNSHEACSTAHIETRTILRFFIFPLNQFFGSLSAIMRVRVAHGDHGILVDSGNFVVVLVHVGLVVVVQLWQLLDVLNNLLVKFVALHYLILLYFNRIIRLLNSWLI